MKNVAEQLAGERNTHLGEGCRLVDLPARLLALHRLLLLLVQAGSSPHHTPGPAAAAALCRIHTMCTNAIIDSFEISVLLKGLLLA